MARARRAGRALGLGTPRAAEPRVRDHRGRSGPVRAVHGLRRPSRLSALRNLEAARRGAERDGGGSLGGRRYAARRAHPRLVRTRQRSTPLHWRSRSLSSISPSACCAWAGSRPSSRRRSCPGSSSASRSGSSSTRPPSSRRSGHRRLYMQQLWGLIEELPDTSGVTLGVGAISLGLLLVMRYFDAEVASGSDRRRLSILAVNVFDLADEGVAVTGDVPTGLFSIGLPDIGWSDAGQLIIGALAVVFVGYSETFAAARAIARKSGYEIDTNQELTAQGWRTARRVSSAVSSSTAACRRPSVADDAGQKSEWLPSSTRFHAGHACFSSRRCSRTCRAPRLARSSSTR